MTRISKSRRIGRKEIELAYGLLDCAVSDLLAASFLFKPGFYALSIYHLQQAAEKADKSFNVYTGYLNERQMRKAGHDRLKADPFIRQGLIEVSKALASIIPGAEEEIKEFKSMKEVLPPMTKIAKASRDSILLFVLDIDEKEMLASLARIKKNQSSGVSRSRRLSVSIRDEILALTHITRIAIVTTPHAWSTRYPTQRRAVLSPKEYTRKLGIVQAAPELIMTLKNAIGVIDRIYRNERLGPVGRFMKFESKPIDEVNLNEGEVTRIRLKRP
jgi:hypothetical protein